MVDFSRDCSPLPVLRVVQCYFVNELRNVELQFDLLGRIN